MSDNLYQDIESQDIEVPHEETTSNEGQIENPSTADQIENPSTESQIENPSAEGQIENPSTDGQIENPSTEEVKETSTLDVTGFNDGILEQQPEETLINTASEFNDETEDQNPNETLEQPVENLHSFETLQNCLEPTISHQMAVHYEQLGFQNIEAPVDPLINQIYNQTINSAVATYQEEHGLTNLGFEETVDILQARFTSLLHNYTDVHQKVVEFHSQILTQLEPYLESATSLELIEKVKEINQLLVSGEASPYEQLNQLAPNACKKWYYIYRHKLDSILKDEYSNYQVHKSVMLYLAREIYHEKMNNIIRQNYQSPKQLSEFHFRLLESFIAIIKDVLMPKEDHQDDPDEIVGNLVSGLNFDFEIFKQENRAKLAQLQKTVDQLITQQKKVYCDKMEEVLKREDEVDLFAIHQDIVAQVQENLRLEIAAKIHKNEPCQNYIRSLEKSIEKYWRSFENIYQSQERKQANQSTPSLSGSCSKENPSRRSKWNAPPIPFIVFHLSLSKINVSIPKGNEIISVCSNPLLLQESIDGNLEICSDSNKLQPNSDKIFKIGELITGNKDLEGVQNVKINNTSVEITVELLLGFIFNALKQQVESQQEALVESCVIIIPFWLTSFQRQQIIDGGKIAQFKETRLINENFAIAMYAYQTYIPKYKDYDIIVLSENSQTTDATIYSTGSSICELKVIGHCGDYKIKKDATPQEKITKACTEALSKTKFGVKMIKNMVKSRRFLGKASPSLIFISFETTDWKLKLKLAKIQISNGILILEDCWKHGAAEIGAVLFATNFKLFSTTLRDQLSSSILYSLNPTADPKTDYAYFTRKEYAELFSHDLCGIVSRTLPDNAREAWFYQESKYNGKLQMIGKLVIQDNSPKVQLEMLIDFQLVAKFQKVNGDKESSTFSWTSFYCDEQRINQLISIINSTGNNIVSESNFQTEEKNDLKEELKRNLKNVHSRISNGEGTFRTEMGRDMALQQIMESLSVLDSSVSPKVTESQQMIYDRIASKYFPS